MGNDKKPHEALMALDAKVHEALEPHSDNRFVDAISWASEIGDQPQLNTISAAVFGVGLLRGDRRMMRAGSRMLAAHLLATRAKDQVKLRVDRARPRSAGGGDDHVPRPGRATQKELTSFPSGHSAGAVAVAQAFAREYPAWRPAALAVAGGVALAQIPRCAHYPTDVGAGAAIGFAAEWVTDAVIEALS